MACGVTSAAPLSHSSTTAFRPAVFLRALHDHACFRRHRPPSPHQLLLVGGGDCTVRRHSNNLGFVFAGRLHLWRLDSPPPPSLTTSFATGPLTSWLSAFATTGRESVRTWSFRPSARHPFSWQAGSLSGTGSTVQGGLVAGN